MDRGDQAAEGPQDGGAKRFIVPAVLVLALVVASYLIYSQMGKGGGGPKRQTVKIAVLPDTPPPPPPPPKEEKKPEPDQREDKPQPQEQPKVQEAPPEPQQLKMDGPAGDGPSAFAAGQVANEYKGGAVGTGGGGVDRLKFALFTNRLTRHIQSALAKDPDLRFDFRINVRVWLDAQGRFERVTLAQSTGDAPNDKALESALMRLAPIDAMPADLPQPMLLRITNRQTG